LLSPDPPDDVILAAMAMRVLDGEFRLTNATETVKRARWLPDNGRFTCGQLITECF